MDPKNLYDIWRLLQCPQCLQCPMSPPIYMCESGHHMCANCSTKDLPNDQISISDADSAYRGVPCHLCSDRMTLMRNIFCEKMIKLVSTCSSMPDIRCVPLESNPNGVYRTMIFERKPSSMPLDADHLTLFEQGKEDPMSAVKGDYQNKKPSSGHLGKKPSITNVYRSGNFCESRSSLTGSYLSASESQMSLVTGQPPKKQAPNHMPLRCPKIPCGKTVASSGLILHFQFDHKDVPHIDIGPNDELNVWITPTVLPFEIERCLALLLLQSNASNVTQASPIVDHHKNRSPFILMGTRLPCHLNTSMQLHRNALTDYPMNSECLVNEFLLVWIIGMESEQFSCKIVATDIKYPSRSLTYIGPIMSVRDILSPREVLATGNCLMLPPGYVNILTESGGGFDLNVTILEERN